MKKAATPTSGIANAAALEAEANFNSAVGTRTTGMVLRVRSRMEGIRVVFTYTRPASVCPGQSVFAGERMPC
jgi:hypothetical protein